MCLLRPPPHWCLLACLPLPVQEMFKQIAGGALLITYIKELFPKVMEQGDATVSSFEGTGVSIKRIKVGVTVLMVGCISASAVAQAGAAGFPGVVRGNATASESEAETTFTPAMTIAYFVGFFVDGVVLAYDDTVCCAPLARASPPPPLPALRLSAQGQ